MRRWTVPPGALSAHPLFRDVLVTVLVLVLVAVAGTGPHGSLRQSAPVSPAISGPCLGAAAPTAATGTLLLTGTSTPVPSLSGVPVRADYFYTEETQAGSQTTYSCVPTDNSAPTGTGGTISVPLPLPPSRCVDSVCVDYYGPYGPLGYATSGAPAGYFEQDPTGGTNPGTIEWDADLYSASIDLTGTHVVSVSAPVPVSSFAWNALGETAPGPLSYLWSLSGLQWTPSSTDERNITVEGTDSTWVGSLSVTVNATYGSATESAESPVLSLLPLATEASSATAYPTPVDPGVPVTFNATGFGAAGYPYSMTVDPGLGAGSVTSPCASTALPNGTVNLTCQLRDAYAASGNVTPTVTISNGYSAATLSVAPVSVHPVEQVSLTASKFVTYPNRTVQLTVSVTHETGSAPYGPVCVLVEGTSNVTCQFQNALAWEFNASFPAVGEYAVRAYVADRFGENVSASAGILIVPPLSAQVHGNASLRLHTNESQALVAVVAGGELPISAVWNSSGAPVATCNSGLDVDGSISCLFSSSSPGWANVTLTLIDSLGSRVSVVFRINVTAALTHLGPPGGGSLPASGWVGLGALAAAAVAALLVALVLRRRTHHRPAVVEENELERMAQGRDHLLARADPVTPRRPDELVADWAGPPVAPEEWAEWIAALVADGNLVPVRGPDRGLAYRRSAPRPSAPTIQFDPTVLEAKRPPQDEDRES